MTRVIRHAGTIVPVMLVLVFVFAYLDARVSPLTWERPAAYATGFISLIFGIEALLKIARKPRGRYPSALVVFFLYQKIPLAIVFFAIFAVSIADIYPGIPVLGGISRDMSGDIVFSMLISSISATALVNMLLWLGIRYGYMGVEVDIVPGRSVLSAWRRRRSARKRPR